MSTGVVFPKRGWERMNMKAPPRRSGCLEPEKGFIFLQATATSLFLRSSKPAKVKCSETEECFLRAKKALRDGFSMGFQAQSPLEMSFLRALELCFSKGFDLFPSLASLCVARKNQSPHRTKLCNTPCPDPCHRFSMATIVHICGKKNLYSEL